MLIAPPTLDFPLHRARTHMSLWRENLDSSSRGLCKKTKPNQTWTSEENQQNITQEHAFVTVLNQTEQKSSTFHEGRIKSWRMGKNWASRLLVMQTGQMVMHYSTEGILVHFSRIIALHFGENATKTKKSGETNGRFSSQKNNTKKLVKLIEYIVLTEHKHKQSFFP